MSKEDAAATSALESLKETEKQGSALDVEVKTPGKTGESAAQQLAPSTGTEGVGDAVDTASGRSRDETDAEQPGVKRKYKKREKEPVHHYPVPPKVVKVVQKSKAFVNHSYNDFSCVPPEAGYEPKSDVDKMTFAQKVHQMVSDESNGYAISWLPHGRAFKILVPKFLETTVLPRYFGHSRYSRFLTQLRTHGFKTLTTGIDQGCYYHECFLRGRLHLCKYMPIHELDPRRKTPDPENEPNFYEISRRYPLEQQIPHYQQPRAASASPGMNFHLSVGLHQQNVEEQGPERYFLARQQQAMIGSAAQHSATGTQRDFPYAPPVQNLQEPESLFPAQTRMMVSRHPAVQGEERPNEMNVYRVPRHQYIEPQGEGGQYEANRYNVPPQQWGQEEGEGGKIQDFQRFKRMDTALALPWYPGSHAAGMPHPSDDSHHKTSVDPAFASMASYPPFAAKEYPGSTRIVNMSQPHYPQIDMQPQQESHQMYSQEFDPQSQVQNIPAQHQQSLRYDPHFQHEYSQQQPLEAPAQGIQFVARRLLDRSMSDALSPGHGETNDSTGHGEIGYFSPSNTQQPPANTQHHPPP